MNFEESLIDELNSIVKVYPLYAPEAALPTYLIYKKNNVMFKKNLDGTTKRAEGNYNLTLVSKTYTELQNKTLSIVDKLLSFLGRVIGTDGPFIQNVTVELTGDFYDPEVDYLIANIKLLVNY